MIKIPGLIYFEVAFPIWPMCNASAFPRGPAYLLQLYTLDSFLDELDSIRASGCALMYYMAPHQNRVIVEFRRYQDTEDMPGEKSDKPKANKELLPLGADWQYFIRNRAQGQVCRVSLVESSALAHPTLFPDNSCNEITRFHRRWLVFWSLPWNLMF